MPNHRWLYPLDPETALQQARLREETREWCAQRDGATLQQEWGLWSREFSGDVSRRERQRRQEAAQSAVCDFSAANPPRP